MHSVGNKRLRLQTSHDVYYNNMHRVNQFTPDMHYTVHINTLVILCTTLASCRPMTSEYTKCLVIIIQ